MVNLPRLLNGVLSAIVAEHDGMKVIGEADARDAVAEARDCDANVVVIGTEEGKTDAVCAMMRKAMPELRIVAIGREGRRATVYEPGDAPREANEVSAEVLVEMLRGAPR